MNEKMAPGLRRQAADDNFDRGRLYEREFIIRWLDRGEPDWPWTAQDIANFICMGCPEITYDAVPEQLKP